MVNRYAAEMGCGQPPPGEEGGAKKSGGPLRQIVRTGLVCLCCDALYSRGPQSINARLVWAQTRHNSRESIGIRDALIMYAVRIVYNNKSVSLDQAKIDRVTHHGNVYLMSLSSVNVRRHGRGTQKVEIKFHLECKLHFPSAQLMFRQMHSTNVYENIEPKY